MRCNMILHSLIIYCLLLPAVCSAQGKGRFETGPKNNQHHKLDLVALLRSHFPLSLKKQPFKLRSNAVISRPIDNNLEHPLSEKEKDAKLFRKLDNDFLNVALPAFVGLTADPLASIVDAMYVGRLGAVDQAAMGIAISAQYSIAKLYNDPLLKTSTSLVAGKTGEDLEASVSTSILTAMVIGLLQMLLFIFGGGYILTLLGVHPVTSEMFTPARNYLFWRALGVPAATVLLVVNGIFRGRGDTRTPLYCTLLGNLTNILLDPLLIFHYKMGCSGAGAATAISQWITAIPLLYLLHRRVPIRFFGPGRGLLFYQLAWQSYLKAGGMLFLRTIAKILSYAFTSSAAARLGTVSMAAYSLTFNLGFATSQLCESIAIAAQALLARDYPFQQSKQRLKSASHLIERSLWLGFVVSSALSIVTFYKQDSILRQLTKTEAVFQASKAIMPMVLACQLWKGLAYSTGGIILGGLDWSYSSLGMGIAGLICVGMTMALPKTLWNIWISLTVFMAVQVIVASWRFLSNQGPWRDLPLLGRQIPDQLDGQEVKEEEANDNSR